MSRPLSRLLSALQRELSAARTFARTHPLRFVLGIFTLTLTVRFVLCYHPFSLHRSLADILPLAAFMVAVCALSSLSRRLSEIVPLLRADLYAQAARKDGVLLRGPDFSSPTTSLALLWLLVDSLLAWGSVHVLHSLAFLPRSLAALVLLLLLLTETLPALRRGLRAPLSWEMELAREVRTRLDVEPVYSGSEWLYLLGHTTAMVWHGWRDPRWVALHAELSAERHGTPIPVLVVVEEDQADDSTYVTQADLFSAFAALPTTLTSEERASLRTQLFKDGED